MFIAPTTETFASMLQKLRSRCKLHPTLGDTPALADILSEANEFVYRQLDNGYPWQSTLTIVANEARYPLITDDGLPVERGAVQQLWIADTTTSRIPMAQGITHAMRADQALRDLPTRWDTSMTDGEMTLEVWAIPDQQYTLHIDHNRALARFSSPTDKPSAPARLVLSYAIAMGKAHLGQQDADAAGKAFQSMLSDERDMQRENRRFLPPTACQPGDPRVVRAADGTFHQRSY